MTAAAGVAPNYRPVILSGKPVVLSGRDLYYSRSREEFALDDGEGVLRPPTETEEVVIETILALMQA